MAIFSATLNQIAFLFLLLLLGFILGKAKFVPDNTATVLSKLENMVFVPALVMGTFIKNFTVKQIGASLELLSISLVIGVIMAFVAIIISKCVTKDKYEQNIFTYGLCFSNFGFMGNAVVSTIFPEIFMEYIVFTLPLWILIYLWGVPALLIADNSKKTSLLERSKALLNPMFVTMIIGMIIGILNIPVPGFVASTVDTMGSCMSPIAMLLTGITVSAIDVKKTFSNLRIYIVSVIRLLAIPLVFIFLAKYINFDETIFVCAVCSLAMPLGLNTIVIPSAYGKDTSTAAGMAVISHLLSALTIPFIFMFV